MKESGSVTEVTMDVPRKKVQGIGGLLLFKILVYTVWMPLGLAAHFSIPYAMFVALYFLAGVLLGCKIPAGVTLAKIAEGASALLGVLVTLAGMPAIGIYLALGGAIWMAYFFASDRVRNTYYPEKV